MITYPLKEKLTFLNLIIVTTLIILFPAISLADADRIFTENNKAVVVVIAYDDKDNPISQGSGFIVREDGAIVTNYHVVSNAVDIKVTIGDKILKVEGLLHSDKENDLVILKVKGEKLQTVKIGDIEKLSVGEKVYVISSPQGLENTISDGILSGLRGIDPKKKLLQITAPVSKGSSGGPVFNKNGEVIGISTFLIEEAQNLNFAMPINLIKDKISSQKIVALKDVETGDYYKTEWAEVFVVTGNHFVTTGQYKEAIEMFKGAIRIKPDYALAHGCLGFAYNFLGMHREAIEAAEHSMKIIPDNPVALYVLCQTYSDLGMNPEAIEACKQLRKINPDNVAAYYNLGLAYARLGMGTEALEAFKGAIRIKPDYAEAHYALGNSYYKLGMYREAIEAYKQAIRLKPDDAEAHNNLGCTYLILKDRSSALNEYKILKDLDPQMANALFNLIYK